MNKFIICFLVIFPAVCNAYEVKSAENADECEIHGFTKGTQSYGLCRLDLSIRDINISQGLTGYSDAMRYSPPISVHPIQRPPMQRPRSY